MLDPCNPKDTIIHFLQLSDKEEGHVGFTIETQIDRVVRCLCGSTDQSKDILVVTGGVVYETFFGVQTVTQGFMSGA